MPKAELPHVFNWKHAAAAPTRWGSKKQENPDVNSSSRIISIQPLKRVYACVGVCMNIMG